MGDRMNWFEELCTYISYERDTGIFRWIMRPPRMRGPFVAGRIAGSVDPHGYRYIHFRRRGIGAHRLALSIIRGCLLPPNVHADHINGDRDDNRELNLRECVNSQNAKNQRKRNGGHPTLKGILPARTPSKWWARIKVNYRHVYLGTFDTPEDAARAYDAAAIQHHGEFARLNFPTESP